MRIKLPLCLVSKKEYIPDLGSVNDPSSSSSLTGSTTIGVVSIIVEIQGDTTEYVVLLFVDSLVHMDVYFGFS